jgi:hypothetical protein
VAGARGEGDDPAAGEMLETGQANLGSGGRQGGSEDSSEASRRSWEQPAARSWRKEVGRRPGGEGGRGSGNSRAMRMLRLWLNYFISRR